MKNKPFWETNINPITGYKFESYGAFVDRRTPYKELHINISKNKFNGVTKTLIHATTNYLEL
jgi:hypothetical protein